MDREFTRKELYDLVWAQPMKTLAASVGISDVALAKHCKKVNIPVPSRGYWARKQAGKRTIQVELPPRFPGAPDRVGGSHQRNYYHHDTGWLQELRDMPIPPVPTFDEDIAAVEERARAMVGNVRCSRKFEPLHPLVGKLLAHDEERRRDFSKWSSSYYAPRYDAGIERRRLLIMNALFMAAARLGCRPSMSTSKYAQEPTSERDISILVGQVHISFTIEPIRSKKNSDKELLRLAFGTARDHASAVAAWEDGEESSLEGQLAEILVKMLTTAETFYRNGLVRNREWVIERKAEAEAELKRQQEEAERKERELQEKLARERIERLLSQANALDRANQIRKYVEATLSRVSEIQIPQSDVDKWVVWALGEADRIDPVNNGSVAQSIKEHLAAS